MRVMEKKRVRTTVVSCETTLWPCLSDVVVGSLYYEYSLPSGLLCYLESCCEFSPIEKLVLLSQCGCSDPPSSRFRD